MTAAVGAAENDSKVVTIQVGGMTCGACAAEVARAFKQVEGVSEARVSYESREAVVTYDATRTSPEVIAKAVAQRLKGAYKLGSETSSAIQDESAKSCPRPAVANAPVLRPSQIDPHLVTFYDVGLVCPAAPKIGCGSRSKPVLLSLVSDPRVAGAWLNEAGTRLAVGWRTSKDIPSPEQLDELLEQYGVAVHAIAESDRAQSLATFRSDREWFDSATVDQLSEQEAGIIATRLLKRLTAKTQITADQDAALRRAVERAFRKRFIDREDVDPFAELRGVAKEIGLDARTVAAIREVLALGFRPLPNEE